MHNSSITFITSVFEKPCISQLSSIYTWDLLNIPTIIAVGHSPQSEEFLKFKNISIKTGIKTERDLGFSGDAPVLNSMIKESLSLISTPLIALINSDILILDDFKQNLEKIVFKYGSNIFLSGNRFDISYNELINSENSFQKIKDIPRKLHQGYSGDIFISSKENFGEMCKDMPDFIMGRMVWDNWLHIFFQENKTPCYNITSSLITLHLMHGENGLFTVNGPAVHHNCGLIAPFRNKMIDINIWPKVEI